MTTLTATRSIVIAATARTVYELLDDAARWALWSPGADAAAPVITAAVPDTRVDAELRVPSPLTVTAHARFDIETFESDLVRVTWTLSGAVDGIAGRLTRLLPLSRFVGRDLDRRLTALKLRAEED